jgi:hypothetical protein
MTQGILHDTVGLGTLQIHGGSGIIEEGVSSDPVVSSPVQPTMVPRNPSIFSRAKTSALLLPWIIEYTPFVYRLTMKMLSLLTTREIRSWQASRLRHACEYHWNQL